MIAYIKEGCAIGLMLAFIIVCCFVPLVSVVMGTVYLVKSLGLN